MASVGEIWLADFGEPYPGEPAHPRPAVVIGPNPIFGAGFPFAIVVPVTTTFRGLALHVEIEAGLASGLDETGYAQCELLRSINARRLVHRLGVVDVVSNRQIGIVIRALLGH